MKYVYLILNWTFGVLFLFVGVSSFVEFPLVAPWLIAIAALLLPPVRNFVHLKTNKELSVKVRAILIFVLFMVFSFFEEQAQDKKMQELAVQQAREEAEKATQLRKKNIDHFNANREQIISSLNKALSDEEYQSVISQSKKYLVAGDKELEQLNAQAMKGLAAIQKARKTEMLLAELKRVSKKAYKRNRNLYQQLLELHPNNELYKTKVAFYAGKIKEERQKQIAAEAKIREEEQKQIAAEARQKRIQSQFSPWNGSHPRLERAIKELMNDPDSYDHVETVYWDRGDHLVVRTTFRGKNAFGGVVKNSVKAKVGLDGQVLQILNH